jgi:hypothetical protein
MVSDDKQGLAEAVLAVLAKEAKKPVRKVKPVVSKPAEEQKVVPPASPVVDTTNWKDKQRVEPPVAVPQTILVKTAPAKKVTKPAEEQKVVPPAVNQPPVQQPPATPANNPAPRRWNTCLVIALTALAIGCCLFLILFAWAWKNPGWLPANWWVFPPSIIQPTQSTDKINQVPEVSGSAFPVLFDAQSTGRNVGFSYNVGVNEGQHGLVFGYQVVWNGKSLGGPNKGCAYVELKPGWYPDLYILDGRYEVRTLPAVNADFWKQKLTMDGLSEQGAHYGCPSGMSYDQVTKWDSALPSPPVTGQVAPAAAPAAANPPVAPASVPAKERKATGANKTLSFQAGESVYGWQIDLLNGKTCTGGECYLTSAPTGGTVTSGVINPWDNEVPAAAKAKVWKSQ